MSILQQNGILTPTAFARIHQRRSGINRHAESTMSKLTTPPAPAGAAFDTANRSKCSRSLISSADQTVPAYLSKPSVLYTQV